jgi:hypothetical protein
MSAGDLKRIRRGIISALAPLVGTVATGSVLARSSSGAGAITIPKHCFLVPIPESAAGRVEISHDLPIRVTAATEIGEGGAAVPVASICGGPRNNFAAGTRMRWDPVLTGVEPEVVVTGGDMSGGAAATEGPGIVREIRAFETLESLEAARDMFAGEVGQLPAIVVAYSGTSEVEPLGEDVVLEAHRWRLYVVTRWGSNAIDTGNEALDILGAVRGLLIRRTSSRGMVFSSPPSSVAHVTRVRITPTVFLWALDLVTYAGAKRTDFRPAEGSDTYADWLVDAYTLSTYTEAQPTELPIVGTGAGTSYDHDFDGSFD